MKKNKNHILFLSCLLLSTAVMSGCASRKSQVDGNQNLKTSQENNDQKNVSEIDPADVPENIKDEDVQPVQGLVTADGIAPDSTASMRMKRPSRRQIATVLGAGVAATAAVSGIIFLITRGKIGAPPKNARRVLPVAFNDMKEVRVIRENFDKINLDLQEKVPIDQLVQKSKKLLEGVSADSQKTPKQLAQNLRKAADEIRKLDNTNQISEVIKKSGFSDEQAKLADEIVQGMGYTRMYTMALIQDGQKGVGRILSQKYTGDIQKLKGQIRKTMISTQDLQLVDKATDADSLLLALREVVLKRKLYQLALIEAKVPDLLRTYKQTGDGAYLKEIIRTINKVSTGKATDLVLDSNFTKVFPEFENLKVLPDNLEGLLSGKSVIGITKDPELNKIVYESLGTLESGDMLVVNKNYLAEALSQAAKDIEGGAQPSNQNIIQEIVNDIHTRVGHFNDFLRAKAKQVRQWLSRAPKKDLSEAKKAVDADNAKQVEEIVSGGKTAAKGAEPASSGAGSTGGGGKAAPQNP